jgi:hypothetical protein
VWAFVPAAHAIHHLFIPIGRPRPKLIRITLGELVMPVPFEFVIVAKLKDE